MVEALKDSKVETAKLPSGIIPPSAERLWRFENKVLPRILSSPELNRNYKLRAVEVLGELYDHALYWQTRKLPLK